jgi:type I restriction enzyme R subunit
VTPEERAREKIDQQLDQAGWFVQHRKDLNLGAGLGVAVREFRTPVGPADYTLFLDGKAAGIIEAKPAGTPLSGVEPQTVAYASNVAPYLKPLIEPLPFLYEASGSETFFTNRLDPAPRSRSVFCFHRPETLREMFRSELDRRAGAPGAAIAPTFLGRIRQAPPLITAGLWPAQIQAVENLEESIRDGRRRALIQMATGSGKTTTAITALYRFIKFGRCRRVLFLVDRGNLGRQAFSEFQAYTTPDDGRKLTELYNVQWLRSNKIDPVNRVVITTIQRLYSILKDDPELPEDADEVTSWSGPLALSPPEVVYNPAIPPEFFDIVVTDECHRSIYTLWRQVLDYFDATIVGLTATPGKHTLGFFNKNLVMEYRHEQAVRDRVNVPFEVYEIGTRITESGSTVPADADLVVGKRDRETRVVRWERPEEELTYAASDLDRSVVAVDQIRTIVREIRDRLFSEIMPGRADWPKMLFYAKSDDHAEDVLRIVREEFGLSNEQAVKITYRPERGDGKEGPAPPSKKSEDLLKAFRNAYNPRVAVTVDMIATGTDIKPLEVLVFLRDVKSATLFEQMIGRGVRVIPDTDFQAVTTDATTKTHFVVIDCVGVSRKQKVETRPLDRARNISFERLLEMVRAGNREEDVLSALAARLDRIDRRLTPDQRSAVTAAAKGVSLRSLVAGIIDHLDPDAEVERARAMAGLPSEDAPTAAQIEAAQQALREEAAAPLAYNPNLCTTILDIRKAQEQTIDQISIDEVTRSRFTDEGQGWAKELTQSFEEFIAQNHDEITALQILYSRPYRARLRYEDIKGLADAIRLPPRQWTPENLWAAYQALDRDRVRGSGGERLLTDMVSLVRYALDQDEELVPFRDRVGARFESWLTAQAHGGREFTGEQLVWLGMMRDAIAGQAELQIEDFSDVPFAQRGGLGKASQIFGGDLERVVDELNRELVA